jgi:UDP-N-acetyl-D-mannosaminuronic acid dehydrogenase
MTEFTADIAVVGGCGRAGLPLAIAFADRGLSVVVYDVNVRAAEVVSSGKLPFDEPGAQAPLERALTEGRLQVTTDPSTISSAESVVIIIGTPVDEHLNPDPQAVVNLVEGLADHLMDGQLLILRSTVYPGVTRLVDALLKRLGKTIDVSFCPERLAEGKAMSELYELPQIVSGRSQEAVDRAGKLFGNLTAQILPLEPEEAELAKLFTNTWRYIKFATANQLFMIANDFGLDFDKIRAAVTHDYPRAADMPRAGFAAGPCLFKDTMQLAAFNNNNFMLGHASMMVNEGLPLYLVARIEQTHDLSNLVVGILGVAFKAESDDSRSSLSYKLKRILRIKAREVLCTDPYVKTDSDLVPLEEVLSRADLLIVATPHRVYRDLDPQVPVIDIWNLFGKGVRV